MPKAAVPTDTRQNAVRIRRVKRHRSDRLSCQVVGQRYPRGRNCRGVHRPPDSTVGAGSIENVCVRRVRQYGVQSTGDFVIRRDVLSLTILRWSRSGSGPVVQNNAAANSHFSAKFIVSATANDVRDIGETVSDRRARSRDAEILATVQIRPIRSHRGDVENSVGCIQRKVQRVLSTCSTVDTAGDSRSVAEDELITGISADQILNAAELECVDNTLISRLDVPCDQRFWKSTVWSDERIATSTADDGRVSILTVLPVA